MITRLWIKEKLTYFYYWMCVIRFSYHILDAISGVVFFKFECPILRRTWWHVKEYLKCRFKFQIHYSFFYQLKAPSKKYIIVNISIKLIIKYPRRPRANLPTKMFGLKLIQSSFFISHLIAFYQYEFFLCYNTINIL